MWPELLAVVKRHKRTTEALLKNAQVHELANGVLTLATSSPGAGPAARRRPEQGRHPRGAATSCSASAGGCEAVVEGAGRRARHRRSRRRQAREAARAAEARRGQRAHGRAGRREPPTATGEPEPAVDPEQAALSLLRAQLGARPIDS